jgi:polysaccharide biosynthesis transport protein
MSMLISGDLKSDDDNWRKSHQSHLNHRSDSGMLNEETTLGTHADEGGLDFGQFLGAIQRRMRIVAVITALTIGATIAWNRTRPPEYAGSFKILIEPVTAEGQVVSDVTGNQKSGGEGSTTNNGEAAKATLDYPTQIQLLLSDKILLPTVQKLKKSHPEISYETLRKSLDISRLKSTEDTKILVIKYGSASEKETKQVLNLVSEAYIQYSLSQRKTNVHRAIKFVDTQLPKVQAQVHNLETALQTFREQNHLIDPTTLGSQLGTQMNASKQERLTTQVELSKARELYRSLEQQIQMQPKTAEAASVLSDSPGYQQLVRQLQDIDVQLKTLSADLTEENPKIISLREKRKALIPLLEEQSKALLGSSLSQSIPNAQSLPYQNPLRQKLIEQSIEASNQVKVLEAKLKGLEASNQFLAKETNRLPAISREYENLQSQLRISTEQLSKFLQKREDLMIAEARQEIPWELIATPSVNKVSSSGLVKDLALGTIVGLLLGSGLALLADKMNDVIYSLKDLREELNISVLGMIPPRDEELNAFKNGKVVPPLSSEHSLSYHFSPFIESFRALNSHIQLQNLHAPIRSLVVSSSLPDEGKTTIAIQLAQAAAAMGQRVLLVNADLRNSNLHADRDNDLILGLTDIVAGTANLMDTVQLLPGEENLYILLSGSVNFDPTSILSSKKMHALMESCKRNFDLVIYDTVPLNFADSLLLIPKTDGLLLVTRLGQVSRKALRNTLRTLNVSKVPILGLAVNMVSDGQASVGGVYHGQKVTSV